MKKYILLILFAIMIVGCDEIKHRDLFDKTDAMVESLYTEVESYGLRGGQEYTTYAEGQEYRIMPMGRLVNVRIEHEASISDYEHLRKSLERHYKGDKRVNSVYICGAGTVMIDCRR